MFIGDLEGIFQLLVSEQRNRLCYGTVVAEYRIKTRYRYTGYTYQSVAPNRLFYRVDKSKQGRLQLCAIFTGFTIKIGSFCVANHR